MKAVLRRELGRLFGSFTGYLIVAVPLAAFSLALFAASRSGQSVSPAGAARQASISLLLVGAICAANGFDRERRMGTDRLLRSLPLGGAALTIGKWCALCVPFLCGCAGACLYALGLRVYAGCAVGPYFASLALYACAGLGATALGLWVSQWTRFGLANALIAAGILALMYYSGSIIPLVQGRRFASPFALALIAAAILALMLAATRDLGWALTIALVAELACLLLVYGNKPAMAAFWTGAASFLAAFSWFDAPVQGVWDLGGVLYWALMTAVCLTLAAIGWRLGALRVRRSA